MSHGASSFGPGTRHGGRCRREPGAHPPLEVRFLEVFFSHNSSSFLPGFLHGGRFLRDLRHCVGGRMVCLTVLSARSLCSGQVLDQARAWFQ